METYLNRSVTVSVSGQKLPIKGTLIDIGSDILAVHNGCRFQYIPLLHLQMLTRLNALESAELGVPQEPPFDPTAELSYRKVLLNAKGTFSEIDIGGNSSAHGYISSIMNDFFVFYSPMYRPLYVSMRHVKSLIPYDPLKTPYALGEEKFPIHPTPTSLARTFEQQLKKFEGEFVVFDLGEHPGKIGLLKSVRSHLIELVAADGCSAFIHLDLIKTVHKP